MSNEQNLLIETADRLFADLAGRRGEDFDASWSHIENAGFPLLLIAEDDGGFGGSWEDAFAVIRLSGYHALPLPVGEAIVTAWLLNGAEGFATLAAPRAEGRLDGNTFSGVLHAVPWGRHAMHVVAEIDGSIVRLNGADAKIERQANPADEPRDTLRFDNAAAGVISISGDLIALGALVRVAQIAGAMDAALAMSISYANERVQFGKPIGKFQALQQNLAIFAEEAAAVNCAGPAACRAMDKGDAGFEIAAAKLRANMAIGSGNMIAHQVHGAIGITREFGLQYFTRRLLSWRSEFGNDRIWADRLGAQVAAAGADDFLGEPDGAVGRMTITQLRIGIVTLAAALGLATAAWATDHDALKKIAVEQCAPHMQAGSGPAPCASVDLASGSAVLKDIKGKTQYLLIPTKIVTGIDDPQILAADAPNYWQAAWAARSFVEAAAGKPIPRDDIGLAINSAFGRSQYQLHIHVDCIRPEVKQALSANLEKIGPSWANLEVDLAGHRYRAMRILGDDLSTQNPFRLLADSDPAVRADMGRQTLAVIAATFADGKNGFILLNDQANLVKMDFASSSNLLDQDCAVLN